MTQFITKLKLYSIVWIYFIVCGVINAQPSQLDSISQITKIQQQAELSLKENDYSKALSRLNQAKLLATPLKNDTLKASLFSDLAYVYLELKNYKKAEAQIIKAISKYRNTSNTKELANAYLIFANLAIEKGNYPEAIKYLKETNTIGNRLDNKTIQAKTLYLYGRLEIERENYTVASNYLDAALPIFQELNNYEYQALVFQQKSNCFLQLIGTENITLENAKEELNKANAIIDSKTLEKHREASFLLQYKIALLENNIGNAQENLNAYLHIKDSLYGVYIDAISKSTETDSDIGDLNEIIASQQDNIDKQQRSINFGKMTTGLSIALIVILSLLTLSLYKNNNLRAKANDLLQDKNIELQLAKEKAEKASLAKAQFLSTITHELRTPLYAVTGLTHLLLEENPNENQREHLNSLKFSGEYLLSLINNILDLNKLEANKVEIEKMTFNLKQRINDVLVALKQTADDKQNTLHLDFNDSIPNKLLGDPIKLSQILMNLIGNSIKFTQNGDVYVRVQKLDQSDHKVKLHFEVEDNGVGISKKKQKSIFETFSQASLQINRKFGGTGLGLSIVKNLLQLMGSKIHLESELGKGSKFWFNISFEISEEYKEVKNSNNIIYDVDYVALENKNILVVEDNKINQMITKKILEKNKMVCQVADNGLDAIKLIEENNFDVVLMDIHMPGISGIEATQRIRKFDKKLPIIALTAVTIDENLDEFYRAGFNEIIPKPFKTEEFFEKIYGTLFNRKSALNS